VLLLVFIPNFPLTYRLWPPFQREAPVSLFHLTPSFVLSLVSVSALVLIKKLPLHTGPMLLIAAVFARSYSKSQSGCLKTHILR